MRSIAVVGAGPSGLYAAQLLLARPAVRHVAVLDLLPTPFGLVRYGVAADHPNTKSVARVLGRVFGDDRARFYGNVRLGRDVTRIELLEMFDAVVYAMGTPEGRRLAVPGEDLAGSIEGGRFVAWYSGHPDQPRPVDLVSAQVAVVVGAGNVAADVTRMLLRPGAALAATDVPDAVLQHLSHSSVRDVHVLCRGGPAAVKFTPPVLRELLDLPDVAVFVRNAGRPSSAGGSSVVHTRDAVTNLRLIEEASGRPRPRGSRRLHLHFGTAPTELRGRHRVESVVVRSTGTDELPRETVLGADIVVRAIGYRGEPVVGLPYDDETGTVPHRSGAVLAPGVTGREYVVGWLKRGPSGVIGTNKADALETVASIGSSPAGEAHPIPDLPALLRDRGVRSVDWEGWLRIAAAEWARGVHRGATSVKSEDRDG